MSKKKDKPDKPPRRRDSDWWCPRCRRPLSNDGRKTSDTVTGKEPDDDRVLFHHDNCGAAVTPGR